MADRWPGGQTLKVCTEVQAGTDSGRALGNSRSGNAHSLFRREIYSAAVSVPLEFSKTGGTLSSLTCQTSQYFDRKLYICRCKRYALRFHAG